MTQNAKEMKYRFGKNRDYFETGERQRKQVAVFNFALTSFADGERLRTADLSMAKELR